MGTAKVDTLIDPLFVAAGKTAPRLVASIPSNPWDRVVFLIVAVISFYYFLLTSYFLVKKAWVMTRTTTSLLVQLCVVLPLWVLWRVVRLVLCLFTCGFCCG